MWDSIAVHDITLNPFVSLSASAITSNGMSLCVPPCITHTDERTAKLNFYASMLLTLFHEYAHLQNGHVDFLRTRGAHAINEAAGALPAGLDPLTRQTLEWDADSSAIQVCLNVVLDLQSGPGTRKMLGLNPIFADVVSGIRALALAGDLIHILFSSGGERVGSSEAWHPPTFSRQHSIIRQLATLAEAYGLMNFTQASLAAAKGIFDVELMWARRNGMHKPTMADPSSSNEHDALVTRYRGRWSEIRPELDLLKLAGRLAP